MSGVPDVSIIIVNYNVEHFLEQCLRSVGRAVNDLEAKGHSAEVFVVDNRSVDGSCAMVAQKFPDVQLMALEENVGFSKGNNVAIRASKGRWVLLLNPDTVVKEDTFSKVLAYADAQPRMGGLGVPMVDGAGRYLPESKRGLPTPWASLCKITGVYRLAPRSSKFNRYYFGHIQREVTAPIEILSGAFMWMRREALDTVGLLDESYFMYGEDIDLSWRLIQGGWENHYFSETSIIHYKGESTKKGSLNYVSVFYGAMLIFASTHFEGRQAKFLTWLIRLAIYLRAGLAVLKRLVDRWGRQVSEATMVFVGLLAILQGYSKWSGIVYDMPLAATAFAVYTLVWSLSLTWSGGYDRPWRIGSVLSGIGMGGLILLAGYGLLPKSVQFSRAVLVLGTAWAAVVFLGFRLLFFKRRWKHAQKRRRLVVASPSAMGELLPMLSGTGNAGGCWALTPERTTTDELGGVQVLGTLQDLAEAMRIHSINEVVFNGRELSAAAIIDAMTSVGEPGVQFRIAWAPGSPLIGPGGPEGLEGFVDVRRAIQSPVSRRKKRMFDAVSALILFLASPILCISGRVGWGRMAVGVLFQRRTWVGYSEPRKGLPTLKKSVFRRSSSMDVRTSQRSDLAYARDYRWTTDLSVVRNALISQSAIQRYGND
jgi:GT2 family glycosyltransferase